LGPGVVFQGAAIACIRHQLTQLTLIGFIVHFLDGLGDAISVRGRWLSTSAIQQLLPFSVWDLDIIRYTNANDTTYLGKN